MNLGRKREQVYIYRVIQVLAEAEFEYHLVDYDYNKDKGECTVRTCVSFLPA